MLALAKNITLLDHATDLLEEVIIVNNASVADYSMVESFLLSQEHIPFRYIHSAENLGVARGRNFALKQGKAPIIIMLDDDSELQLKDSLVKLLQEFDQHNTERPKAIVSFKVLYYENLEMQENALPHKKFEEYKDKSFFQTYYYAGGAHAIKREAMEKAGLYPEDFFYGMEEYDLSYRILEAGYSIVYSDKIVMLHKESPLGRTTKREKLRMMWVNKTTVSWRYLPQKYFYSTAFMWSLEYLKKSGLDFNGFIKGWKQVFSISGKEEKHRVSDATLRYLKSVGARLWY
jgi:GT2 family glycosyltransferase